MLASRILNANRNFFISLLNLKYSLFLPAVIAIIFMPISVISLKENSETLDTLCKSGLSYFEEIIPFFCIWWNVFIMRNFTEKDTAEFFNSCTKFSFRIFLVVASSILFCLTLIVPYSFLWNFVGDIAILQHYIKIIVLILMFNLILYMLGLILKSSMSALMLWMLIITIQFLTLNENLLFQIPEILALVICIVIIIASSYLDKNYRY